jgi:hypothetical protein
MKYYCCINKFSSCSICYKTDLQWLLISIISFQSWWQSFLYLYNTNKNCLIDYLLFYVPLKNISLIWRRHHYRWKTAKFRPMLGAQGLRAGRDIYRATPAVTQGLCFSGLIRRAAPFRRLLRHMRGCGDSILTRIPMSKNWNKLGWPKNSMQTSNTFIFYLEHKLSIILQSFFMT